MSNFRVKSSIQDYEVHFTSDSKKALLETWKSGDMIIIDRVIYHEYPELLANGPWKEEEVIVVDATESTKSYQGVEPVIEYLIKNGFRRNHRLIGIGGGIIQDVTAFIASILYRGVSWFFFPTTLLAQGDSCIGSKTSINFKNFKNQIGGFYPPVRIFIDKRFLSSLSMAELKSGLGEMCHYFVVQSQEDFDRYKTDYPKAIEDLDVINGLVQRSLEIKKAYIEIDEFDKNERQVFNYGHSFGHAIESYYQYAIPHGIAVSFGMDMSNFVSMKKGYLERPAFDHMHELFEQIWSDFSISDLDVDALMDALKKDKKNVDHLLGLILNKGCGRVFKDLTEPNELFVDWMHEYLRTYHQSNDS
ncbi:3-dehydroquinate synthase [Cryomorphaceae bacterium]|nr:3-dehydroquinate synthase [Cryomorphaceae bacterium]